MKTKPDVAEETALILAVDAPLMPLLAKDREQARVYQANSKSKNTQRAYKQDWKAFVAWCVANKVSPLPVKDVDLCAYLSRLASEPEKSLSRVQRAYSAIALAHRAWQWRDEEGEHEGAKGWESSKACPMSVKRTLDGIRRDLGVAPKNPKHAITDEELRLLCGEMDRRFEALEALRNKAILLGAFCGAFRRSELVGLRVEDLTFTTQGVTTLLRRSKTDQEGHGKMKGIPFLRDERVCPVRTLTRWLEAAGIAEGPVFRPITHGHRVLPPALDARIVARLVKMGAIVLGIPATKLGGHSLRAGFVTTAYLRGKSADAIMNHTGHVDYKTFRKYIRHLTVFDNNAASGIL
jgi:integrase